MFLKDLYRMLLVLHWALSNCLRPLWDLFHAFKIKIMYTPYILMLTSTLEVTQNMPPIHTKILHRFDMNLHVAKRMWAMQKKSRRKISVPRSMGERKRKKKDSSYFKIRDRVMQKWVRVPSKKIPHTCTSWSDCMICFLYWIRFLTLQYMQDMYASFHSLPWAPQKALLEIERREMI